MAFEDCDVHTVFLRGPVNEALAASIPGEVTFMQLRSGELRGLKFDVAGRLKLLLSAQPPDVIIAHRYKPFFLALMLNYQFKLKGVVGVMHEFGFLHRFTRSLYSRFWPDNVSLVGVSQAVVDEIAQTQTHLRARLFTVPHAIQAQTLDDPVTARAALGIPLGVYCFATVGRLVRKKNHQLLLEAFALVPGQPVLAIVGDGVLLEALKRSAKQLDIDDRVIFCGAHLNAQVHYKAFDAFVLPSTHEEAFGIVLLEAMAASVPIVCSDAPGPLSVINNAGLVFESGNAQALADKLSEIQSMPPDLINQQVARGINTLATKFSVRLVRQQLRAVPALAQVINQPPAPADEMAS